MTTTDLAPLGQALPAVPPAATAAPTMPAAPPRLARRQKAAIVVRLLLAEGASLPLSDLPDALQAELTQQMVAMRYVDRATLRAVIEEFAAELDSIGLSFPGGLDGALNLLEGAISPDLAAKLRRQSGMVWADDPWEAIAKVGEDKLLSLLTRESPEIGAVLLSKIDTAMAAALLGRLPGDRARRLTLAVSETAGIAPEAVFRIGASLAAELKAEPPRAFPAGAVDRVGAILNLSEAQTRDALLEGLAAEDADFAAELRRAILTFPDLAERLNPRDVPAALRSVPQEVLVTILAGADERERPACDFLLANMSKRLAEGLRDEAAEAGAPSRKATEAAQGQLIGAIRALIDGGEITLVVAED